MTAVESLLHAHPQKPSFDTRKLKACIEACRSCGEACALCADGCLAEERVAMLRACIRLNLDCALICDTTATLLTRLFRPNGEVLRAQVEVCAKACAACALECTRHVDQNAHCKLCAAECRNCEDACRALLAA